MVAIPHVTDVHSSSVLHNINFYFRVEDLQKKNTLFVRSESQKWRQSVY